MENLLIEGTNKTPLLSFDAQTGRFLIQGRSIPENSVEFYRPLFDWLEKYLDEPCAVTALDVKLEYFNTSSSKCLVEVFRRLEPVHKESNSVTVNWFFEEDDEDMEESGEDFKEIINLPIHMNVIPVDPENEQGEDS